ncbi:MAG: phage Gp37/Gp68 family protein [Ruminococcus sp.]|nr:phage Gp37/Gp68 family protein [Ruminococcus sp.]
MNKSDNIYADWNPWHGCTKISPGCKYCYVYRQDEMYGNPEDSSNCHKNTTFDLPLRKKRDGTYKIPSGKIVFTCFTSDFLLPDADKWRAECWKIMKLRSDCWFYFFTKRIDRLAQCLPDDWGEGYDNVIIGCTVENQDRADFRLPVFLSLPIRHKSIIVAPLLEKIDISAYLNDTIEEVSVSGESGNYARPCCYDWILNLRSQCIEKNIPFRFHQTGAHFIKDRKLYNIRRKDQISQARKAGIDYLISKNAIPETAELNRQQDTFRELTFFDME